MTPQRIQRKRTRGWKMPPNTVYVGRPTKWGNPYRVGDGLCKTAIDVVWFFESWLIDGTNYTSEQTAPEIAEIRRELAGKNLACFCALDEPCHADVLLRIANETAEDGAS
jgi:hypothetical protein